MSTLRSTLMSIHNCTPNVHPSVHPASEPSNVLRVLIPVPVSHSPQLSQRYAVPRMISVLFI